MTSNFLYSFFNAPRVIIRKAGNEPQFILRTRFPEDAHGRHDRGYRISRTGYIDELVHKTVFGLIEAEDCFPRIERIIGAARPDEKPAFGCLGGIDISM